MEASKTPGAITEISNIRSGSPQPARPIGPCSAASIAKIIKRNFSTVEHLLTESTCRNAEIYVHLEVPLLKERASVKLNVKAEKFQEVLQDVVGGIDATLTKAQAHASVVEAEGQGDPKDLARFKEDCSRRGQKWRHSVEKLRSKTLLTVGTLEEDLGRSLDQLRALRAENKHLQEEIAALKAAARRPSQHSQHGPGRSGSGSAAERHSSDRSDRGKPDPRRFSSEPGVKVVVKQSTGGREYPSRRNFDSDPPRSSSGQPNANGQPQVKLTSASIRESLRNALTQTRREPSSSRSTAATDGDVDYRFAYEPIPGIQVMLPTLASHNQVVTARAVSPQRSFIDNTIQMAALQGVHPSVHPGAGSAMSPNAQPTGQKRSSSLSNTIGRFFRFASGSGRSSSQSPEARVPRAWP